MPGTIVAIPETRQLDVLARLFERRGFGVLRCPLIGIVDSPDSEGIESWINRFIDDPPDLFVIYTGEGVDRLVAAAERCGRRDDFVATLGRVPLLTRGPKPVRALRALGIRPTHQTERPTTNGVMQTLDGLPLEGLRVAVQLYGGEPNSAIEAYLETRHATAEFVAPYVYVDAVEDAAVNDLIAALRAGEIGAIVFTSRTQVQRLVRVAGIAGQLDALNSALADTIVAAVGPVAARELDTNGIRVDVMPDEDFFMKPLVTRLTEKLGGGEQLAGSG